MATGFRTMLIFFLLTFLVATTFSAPNHDEDQHPNFEPKSVLPTRVQEKEKLKSFWNEEAQKRLEDKLSNTLNTNIAKNVILFLGDGMSIPTVAAARMYQGGEEVLLSFDKFPWTGLAMTYAVDRQVADSANTATAYLCGVKANYGTIGVGPEVLRSDCTAQNDTSNYVFSIGYYSQLRNKRVGIVTTSRVTHASPAGVYAHTANRDWESDTDVISRGSDPEICTDIARQLVYGETGKNIDVILGGGRRKFIPLDYEDEEGQLGTRTDGSNLIEEWLAAHDNSQYVWNKADLFNINSSTEKILGLFASDHMDYNLDRDTDSDPSLVEMTTAAINLLSKSKEGFFLFVEGARIDMAHHDTKGKKALDETIQFSLAIEKAVNMTSEDDTLIVVTSDHSHTLAYSGYATRGNDILGFAGTAKDRKPHFTLTYANGPGYESHFDDGGRYDATNDLYADNNYRYPASSPLDSETHGGDDVGVFARGPFAHLFSGVIEQNVIPHFMEYASCTGVGKTVCNRSFKSAHQNLILTITLFVLAMLFSTLIHK